MHIQHDIPSQAVTDAAPVVAYTVPDRFKLKMTEIILTNPDVAPANILIQDVSGMNSVEKLNVIVPAGETLIICGIMRHFAKSVVVTNLTAATTVSVSSSGYLC